MKKWQRYGSFTLLWILICVEVSLWYNDVNHIIINSLFIVIVAIAAALTRTK